MSKRLSRQIVGVVQRLRGEDLFKLPGVAEALDWTQALMTLDGLSSTRRPSTTRSACCSGNRTTSPRSHPEAHGAGLGGSR
jgi:hypothetical protein